MSAHVPFPTVTSAASAPIEGLYREHRPWLMGWLRRRVDSPQQAEDLSQDVFMRILQGSKTVRADQARVFLATIARGLVIDYRRRSALEQAYLDYLVSLPQGAEPSPQERLQLMQALCTLDRMLAELPPRVRQAFLLSQIDGLGYAEIAVRLDVSLSSVQQYMIRAMTACCEAFHD